MKVVDKAETRKWLSDNGLLTPDGVVCLPGPSTSISFRIPVDSGKKTALSRLIASFFDLEGESLLWINEFGIWPSSEDPVLFSGFRKSLGESRPVQERPGHVFLKEDVNHIRSLLAMVFYFVWGAIVVSAHGGILIEISHDELLSIRLRCDATRVATLKATIERVAGKALEGA